MIIGLEFISFIYFYCTIFFRSHRIIRWCEYNEYLHGFYRDVLSARGISSAKHGVQLNVEFFSILNRNYANQ